MSNNTKKIYTTTDFDKLYFDSIKNLQDTKDYRYVNIQIDCIKKALKENSDADEDLIELLIDLVEEKISLEYENINEYLLKQLNKNIPNTNLKLEKKDNIYYLFPNE